jgi:signal transduction histidine kinase
MKHASPTAVDVFLNYNPQQLVVTVKDDGKGFDTSENHKSGIGLSNIFLRAEALKANISVDSTPGKGTIISLVINRPIAAA